MTSTELEIFKQAILDEARVMMQTTGQVTQYIGARYVPLIAEPIEWSDKREYEPLTIVTNQGSSYTSRQFVPKGTPITNKQFWAATGNFNAQIEQYRQEVAKFDGRITAAQNAADSKAPINHAANSTEYGVGNGLNYGHVKLSDEISSSDSNNGISATPKLVKEAIDKASTFVTPEQFGAVGDGIVDDTEAVKEAVATGKNVIGNGSYKCSSPIDFNKSHQMCIIKSIISTADYAISVGNGTMNQHIIINSIDASKIGAICKTTSVSARLNVHIGSINAKASSAFDFLGGPGGVLDSYFSGQVWSGATAGLRVIPTDSYIGNITFDSIRFTATSNNATSLTIDSSDGAITQLHFPNSSVEPESTSTVNNGILINVVNNIEHCDGYFRTTELTGLPGFILKIKGAVTTQLSQGLHFTFDHILPSKIDLSELVMSQYYALDSPVCIIDCEKIVFASQPQATRMVIRGNKKHCKPLRGRYVQTSGEYTWSYARQIETAIELTGDTTLNLPEWFNPDEDTLLVNPASHNVIIKVDDHGSSQTLPKISASTWLRVSFYRDNNNKLYIVAS